MLRRVTVLAVLCLAVMTAGGAALAQEESGTERLTGTFSVLWGDPRSDENAEPSTVYTISEGDESTELLLDRSDTDSLGGPQALSGEEVEVVAEESSGDAAEVLDLELAEPNGPAARESGKAAAAVNGARPAVSILCRFKDSTGEPPEAKAYFDGLSGASKPGLDHYWREVSYGNINLAGSKTAGWYTLPQSRSYYVQNNRANLGALAQDCAKLADSQIDFSKFTNVNLMFDQPLDCCAWGGGRTLDTDEGSQYYGVTWMPPWAWDDQFVLAHELGHSYGLPHSSGPYQATYDSNWDPMSNGSECNPPDTRYGCVSVHTIAYHKDKLGWIPPSKKYTATTARNQRLTIERIGTLASSNYLMVQIPISGSSTQFYTVESRRYTGYDAPGQLPGEAIVIHKVDTTLGDRNAQVVDADRDGDTNDEGAIWLPGETFTDEANGISVRVDSATANGYSVTINPSGVVTPPQDTTAPRGSVVINNGATYTNKPVVRLRLGASDEQGGSGLAKASFSRDGKTWTAWSRYVSGRDWSLGSGKGRKFVYVRFMDNAGNISARVSDSIVRK